MPDTERCPASSLFKDLFFSEDSPSAEARLKKDTAVVRRDVSFFIHRSS